MDMVDVGVESCKTVLLSLSLWTQRQYINSLLIIIIITIKINNWKNQRTAQCSVGVAVSDE